MISSAGSDAFECQEALNLCELNWLQRLVGERVFILSDNNLLEGSLWL